MHLFATAPKEAPTTRGFASILVAGLAGLTVDEVLAVPDDYPHTIGLTEAVSPLRIRGMMALLGRIQRQVREKQPLRWLREPRPDRAHPPRAVVVPQFGVAGQNYRNAS